MEYEVKPGDTLWGIAARCLGDGAQFRSILRANPGITNPRALRPGLRLTVPDSASRASAPATAPSAGVPIPEHAAAASPVGTQVGSSARADSSQLESGQCGETVVILIPFRDSDAGGFRAVARQAQLQCYRARRTLTLRVVSYFTAGQCTSDFGVMFCTDDAPDRLLRPEDLLPRCRSISRFVCITHAGFDGPIFDHPVANPNQVVPDGIAGRSQPLERQRNTTGYGPMDEQGMRFWSFLGQHMAPNGAIILLGCNQGVRPTVGPGVIDATYGELVAQQSRRATFAPRGKFGAGDVRVAIPALRQLEAAGSHPAFHWTPPRL